MILYIVVNTKNPNNSLPANFPGRSETDAMTKKKKGLLEKGLKKGDSIFDCHGT